MNKVQKWAAGSRGKLSFSLQVSSIFEDSVGDRNIPDCRSKKEAAVHVLSSW